MVIIIFSVSLLLLLSCRKSIYTYRLAISNQYFEPLIHSEIGSIDVDTLPVDSTTNFMPINKGGYKFSTHTLSGLVLTSTVTIAGSSTNITLIVNKNGQIKAE